MVTGFYPEPNYILASTASISFVLTAGIVHWLVAWHHQVPLSLAIVLSSIWFHTQRSQVAYVTDQVAILLWTLGALYEAYLRGAIPMSVAYLCLSWDILVFYVGYLGNCYAFSPDRSVSTFFHATTHFVSFGGFVAIMLLSPQPTLTTVKILENPQ